MAYSRCGANYIRIQGTKNEEFAYKEELICSRLLHFCFLRLVFIVTQFHILQATRIESQNLWRQHKLS